MKKGFIPVSEEFPEGLLKKLKIWPRKHSAQILPSRRLTAVFYLIDARLPPIAKSVIGFTIPFGPSSTFFHSVNNGMSYLFCARAKIYQKNPEKRKILLGIFATDQKKREIESESIQQTQWIGDLPEE